MATNEEIGARLMRARLAKELGREDVAKRLGISVATIQHHENGVRGIRRDVAEQYAKALKFNLEWLYTGRGDMAGGPETDADTAEVISIMPGLDARRRAQLAEYARFLTTQRDKEKK